MIPRELEERRLEAMKELSGLRASLTGGSSGSASWVNLNTPTNLGGKTLEEWLQVEKERDELKDFVKRWTKENLMDNKESKDE